MTVIIDLCCQSLCMNPAAYRMFWPSARAGRAQLLCEAHREHAIACANALGFVLEVLALDEVLEDVDGP